MQKAASEPPATRSLAASESDHSLISLQCLTSAAHIMESLCRDCQDRCEAGDVFHDPALSRAGSTATHSNVLKFLCFCQDVSKWSVETNMVAVVFAVRFSRKHSVNHANWERVLLIALLLAQKLIDDSPLCEFPPRT
jgi:hypothetical protein